MTADTIVAILLAIVLPAYALWSWRRFQQTDPAHDAAARLSAYAETIVIEWALATLVLVVWIIEQRSAIMLGLAVTLDLTFVAAMAVAFALGGLLIRQASSVPRLDASAGAALQRQLAAVAKLMPRTAGERDVFLAVAVTAGFCEELLYRGFLIGYLSNAVGLAGAVALSTLIFGIAHAYQGTAGAVKATAVGLVMAVVYVVSGSIWPAVVLHAAVDIQGGLAGYHVFARWPRVDEPTGDLAPSR